MSNKIKYGILKKRGLIILLFVFLLSIFSSCDTASTRTNQENIHYRKITSAGAILHGIAGNNVHGSVTFHQKNDGILITANLTGLTPGSHGFHIHEFGDHCTQNNGKDAGGHFNPDNKAHGKVDTGERHLGDLGNIIADKNGIGYYEHLDKYLSLKDKGKNSIIGRSVVIHAGQDDFTTQPSGAAGPRIACGIIRVTQGHI